MAANLTWWFFLAISEKALYIFECIFDYILMVYIKAWMRRANRSRQHQVSQTAFTLA